MKVDAARIIDINNQSVDISGSCVVYWMQSDQRAEDNWALQRGVELANSLRLPVVVVFVVYAVPNGNYWRHYDFMLKGLAETAERLRARGIGFAMKYGKPDQVIPACARELKPAAVVTDQSYLAWGMMLRHKVGQSLGVRLEGVDAATIVPPRVAYPKAAYGAYLLRPKLRMLRERFLTEIPADAPDTAWLGNVPSSIDERDLETVLALVKPDKSVGPVGIAPGPAAAQGGLRDFIAKGFGVYAARRNDPMAQASSRLSAYLHFGQLSSQRVAFEVLNSEAYDAEPEAGEAYLDELITWRELAVNYVLYCASYNTYDGIPAWAQRSLSKHRDDPREFLYTLREFERASTHDELWNAAQLEMVRSGYMHGYMRMYWAKKILEWSESASAAIRMAVYLNDKYSLDGRDANGYAGILWAIGGLHDRPWFDRPIYGQVRYMSYGGAKSKFDVAAYVDWVQLL